ncbi:hypothetical protein DW322_06635 [Rhodococcus rhodnii]|uniref:ABC3 transporter permease protein domain-containing protein n=2 Tax=Rhodococcus rhodnii TaxID=38312 RepID=R7WNW7_9NOCA|nr:hypothetical protein [Rhodococcus rhodnii]EOM76965.1 hypothetical protein Rrhod_1584 [Rhodococcus rhodnii LMG 5362]TXG89949.1 hypothetical protein DW322_06635 [Rhodococcus rhodnii]
MTDTAVVAEGLRRADAAAWRAVGLVLFTTALLCSTSGSVLGLLATADTADGGVFRPDTAALVADPASVCAAADVESRLDTVDPGASTMRVVPRRADVDGVPTVLVGDSLVRVVAADIRPAATQPGRVEGLSYAGETNVTRRERLSAVQVDDAVLGRLAGSDRVGAIIVSGAPADAVADVAAKCGWTVESPSSVAADLGIVPASDVSGAMAALSTMVGFVVLLAVVVLSSSTALATVHMLPTLAVVRAVGAGRMQLVFLHLRTLLGAAAVPTAVGAVCGVPASALLLMFLRHNGAVPESVAWEPSVGVLGGALLSGIAVVVVAVVGAGVSLRRVWRCAPSDVLRPPRAGRSSRTLARFLGGVSVLAIGSTMIVPIAMSDRVGGATIGFSMVVLLAPAAALLAPWLVLPLVSVAGRVWSAVDRRVGGVVAADLRFYDRFVVATGTPVLVAVALVSTLFGLQPTLAAAYADQAHDSTPGAVVVRGTAVEVEEAFLRDEIDGERTPGGSTWAVVGVPGSMLDRGELDPGATSGAVTGLGADEFAASESLAGKQHWKLGGTYSVPMPDGSEKSLTLRFTYGRDLVFGQILVDGSTLAAVATAPYPVARLQSGTADSVGTLGMQGEVTIASTEALVIAVLVVYCAAALSGSVVLGVYGRKHHFVALRRQGTTAGQRARLLIAETTVAVGAAVTIGLVVGMVTLLPTGMLGAGLGSVRIGAWTWGVGVGAVIVAAVGAVAGLRAIGDIESGMPDRSASTRPVTARHGEADRVGS